MIKEKKVAIVGFAHSTMPYHKKLGDDWEIWSVNSAWNYDIPRIDRLFEIHPEEYLEISKKGERGLKHAEWLRQEHPFPIYTIDPSDYILSQVQYPYDEIVQELISNFRQGNDIREVFTSSMDYALAQALFEGYTHIKIFGVEMNEGTEYAYQKSGFTFWIGVAIGKGVVLELHERSKLIRPRVYHKGAQMLGRQDLETHAKRYEQMKQAKLAIFNDLHGKFTRAKTDFEKGNIDDEQLGTYGRSMNQANNELHIITGAHQAVLNLIKAIDIENPDVVLVNDLMPVSSDDGVNQDAVANQL